VSIPVLHMPQMVGMALGLSKEALGLNHNVTDVGIE
jgi:heterodisulfide reductase subunit B